MRTPLPWLVTMVVLWVGAFVAAEARMTTDGPPSLPFLAVLISLSALGLLMGRWWVGRAGASPAQRRTETSTASTGRSRTTRMASRTDSRWTRSK